MKKRELDLTNAFCHVCGEPLIKDIHNQKEKCINPLCSIRNIKFTIPFVKEPEDDSKS